VVVFLIIEGIAVTTEDLFLNSFAGFFVRLFLVWSSPFCGLRPWGLLFLLHHNSTAISRSLLMLPMIRLDLRQEKEETHWSPVKPG
jgi:hypothetical protein